MNKGMTEKINKPLDEKNKQTKQAKQ